MVISVLVVVLLVRDPLAWVETDSLFSLDYKTLNLTYLCQYPVHIVRAYLWRNLCSPWTLASTGLNELSTFYACTRIWASYRSILCFLKHVLVCADSYFTYGWSDGQDTLYALALERLVVVGRDPMKRQVQLSAVKLIKISSISLIDGVMIVVMEETKTYLRSWWFTCLPISRRFNRHH